jgi:hypothetical protein
MRIYVSAILLLVVTGPISRAQSFSVAVNGGDYAPAKSITLDFGVGHTQDQFELGRFFAITIKNTSGRSLTIKETAESLQPIFWATGVATSGTFTLAANQERTLTFKAKCPSCTSATNYKGKVSWTATGVPVFGVNLTGTFGPQNISSKQGLEHVVACCDKTWEYKDATIPYPTYYHLTGWSSPNNWGPDNGDRASGWRKTDVIDEPAGRRVAVHYGIQSDECRPCTDPTRNQRRLDPILAFGWALDETSIQATIESSVQNAKPMTIF